LFLLQISNQMHPANRAGRTLHIVGWTIYSKEISLFLWLHGVVWSIEFGDVSVWQMTAKADDAKAGASGIETFLWNWDKNWSKHYGIKRERAPGQLPGYKAAAPTKVDANKSFWAKPFYRMFNLIHNNIMYGFSVLLDSVFYASQYGVVPQPRDLTQIHCLLTYIILEAITISEELDMDCVHQNLPLCQPNINQLHPQFMQP
jgi:hypothetical protein